VGTGAGVGAEEQVIGLDLPADRGAGAGDWPQIRRLAEEPCHEWSLPLSICLLLLET
jgi:hypothetical protein